MAQVSKLKLSGSTDGRPISATATTTPGTLMHTAVAGVTIFDEVYLYAYNPGTIVVPVSLELGGTTGVDTLIVDVPPRAGRVLIIDGMIFQNGVVVRAYVPSANAIYLSGFVNQIKP